MSSSVEEILENRINELEKKIYGLEKKPNTEGPMPENSIIESVAHANTLISSALSGREKINTLVKRWPELESYTESDFEPTDLQTEVKLEYILAVEPEIRENAQRLIQLKELLPVLESDRFKNLPELSEKLHDLSLMYVDLGEKAEQVNSETRSMINRYNDIIMNVSKTLIALETEVSELERKAEPKKVMD
ncbi:dynactin subunit 3 isoform X1 [Nasonia vitripennis]|uniref:Dynactin subunit 3 n=1 Tax=Nasonia vitripennis TaxID=7425 RepID=A0A7M6UGG1_NASVI|nr:dynactin subunit 3 [Nasonia vitripennis]XP_008214524.1 dynactin subunit 3 isoform X1 [Nasonia vitripennis]XP_031786088.1 dynactin subunit 3 isoform X1 [Nasonia vitripennis]XP_031786089.1 dynactin subunit 3 isoform X1 [Nasonia vitripennis]XP_031786090.1 dynactin subunit 3 isoform X1 [Nasonia vitripennis]XP_032454668.1 dynactin subunit 3 isoform X1 [Nasonia vitripennis]